MLFVIYIIKDSEELFFSDKIKNKFYLSSLLMWMKSKISLSSSLYLLQALSKV